MAGEWVAVAIGQAREAWPGVDVPPDAFREYVVQRLPAGTAPSDAPALLRLVDLYLACGCARRDARALRLFEERILAEVTPALRQARISPSYDDEVRQGVRERLLVGPAGAAPKILEYSGRGSLRGWLRVVAVRAALMLVRKEKHEKPLEAAPPRALQSPADDPELALLKSRYRSEFRAAFREALASLAEHQRALLRQRYILGLTLEEIGERQGVHLSTAARWLEKAQKRLLAETRRALAGRLKLHDASVESVWNLVQSRLDVSLRGLIE